MSHSHTLILITPHKFRPKGTVLLSDLLNDVEIIKQFVYIVKFCHTKLVHPLFDSMHFGN